MNRSLPTERIRPAGGPAPVPGRLTVRVEGQGVDLDAIVSLFVNGTHAPLTLLDLGANAEWTSPVAPGTYVVSAGLFSEGAPLRVVTHRVDVAEGADEVVRFTRSELLAAVRTADEAAVASPDRTPASLSVRVSPQGAEAFLDGVPLAAPQVTSFDANGYRRSAPVVGAPLSKSDLVPGTYDLDVTAPGYVSQRRRVVVTAGSTQQIDVALEKAPTGLAAALGGGSPAASGRRATVLLYGVGAVMAAAAVGIVLKYRGARSDGAERRDNPPREADPLKLRKVVDRLWETSDGRFNVSSHSYQRGAEGARERVTEYTAYTTDASRTRVAKGMSMESIRDRLKKWSDDQAAGNVGSPARYGL